jgi:hypothetical protein
VDEQWQKRLLEAANVALDRFRAPSVNSNPGLVEDLKQFRAHLEANEPEDDEHRQ